MKRKITIAVFALFLLSVVVFVLFGPQIRAALSPAVKYAYPEMRDADGRMLNAVPASALWTGDDGRSYVWRIARSDAFPEPAFVVDACPVTVEAERDGMVAVFSPAGAEEPREITAIRVELLPAADRRELRTGIPAADPLALAMLLEDLGS